MALALLGCEAALLAQPKRLWAGAARAYWGPQSTIETNNVGFEKGPKGPGLLSRTRVLGQHRTARSTS